MCSNSEDLSLFYNLFAIRRILLLRFSSIQIFNEMKIVRKINLNFDRIRFKLRCLFDRKI